MTERTTFNDLGLIEPILKALHEEGYTTPTPIQSQAIPHLLRGRDLLGCAQTGTGKTAAFAIPILQRHTESPSPGVPPPPEEVSHGAGRKGPQPRHTRHGPRTLILTPTRELAIQIGESFAAYGRHLRLRHTVIFGGVGQKPQTDALQRGVDILVATPGRLLDLMGQGFVHLDKLEVFVLDEADRMLDMGFIHDVRKVIAKLPVERQTLFFSATMPPEIAKLANSILTDPVKVEVTPQSSTAEKVEQQLYFVDRTDKNKLLAHLLQGDAIREALVFTRTKHGANKVAKVLLQNGVNAEAIHGNKSQSARQNALKGFKEGKVRVLVATDIAARGIDIDGLGHVINFDLPNVPETYVHRIGRTGRAGAAGIALSFCDHEEKEYLRDITRLIKREVPVVAEHPYVMTGGPKRAEPEVREPRQPRGPGRGGRQRAQGQRDGRGQQRGPRPEQRTTAGANAPAKEGRDRRRSPQEARDGQPRTQQDGRGRSAGRNGRDRRPGERAAQQRNERPRHENGHGPAKPDYATMTKELFGDAVRNTSDRTTKRPGQKEKKRSGSILGRLFGR